MSSTSVADKPTTEFGDETRPFLYTPSVRRAIDTLRIRSRPNELRGFVNDYSFFFFSKNKNARSFSVETARGRCIEYIVFDAQHAHDGVARAELPAEGKTDLYY